MRIAVMGAGGLGATLGALLSKSGNDVSLIARGPHLEAIRERGLRLTGAAGEFSVDVTATDNPSNIGPVDLVIFSVKTYHNEQAIPAIRPMVGDATAVLTFQNGVESAKEIRSAVERGLVLPGVYFTPGHIQSPGVVAVVSQPSAGFGNSDGGQTHQTKEIQLALQESGVNVDYWDDATIMLWSKFVPFCALAGSTSASRTRIKRLFTFKEGHDLFSAIIEEGRAVARAEGVDVPADVADKMVASFENLPDDYQPSMQTDFQLGRQTELEAINGTIVRLGRAAGVPTPVNSFIYTVLLPHKDGEPQPEG
jgi:2-dehydropantoate 2-reductase